MPEERDLSSVHGPDHLHGVAPRNDEPRRLQPPLRELPDLLRELAVIRVVHDHVRGKAVGERPHFAGRAAGGRLAGVGERGVAGFGDLPREEVDVVDQVVGPRSPCVLVESHRPEGRHLPFGSPYSAANSLIASTGTPEICETFSGV